MYNIVSPNDFHDQTWKILEIWIFISIWLDWRKREGDEMGDVRERSNNAVGLEVMAEYYL